MHQTALQKAEWRKNDTQGTIYQNIKLVFFLTMEKFGKVHPSHRFYEQWDQMSYRERSLHMNEMAQLYIDAARTYDHSAIFVHPNPGGVENTQWLLELIREKSGGEYYIMMHGDPTWSIPDGDSMMVLLCVPTTALT